MAKAITDDGGELTVTSEQAVKLVVLDLIYECDDCCGNFHIMPDVTWEHVEHALEASL